MTSSVTSPPAAASFLRRLANPRVPPPLPFFATCRKEPARLRLTVSSYQSGRHPRSRRWKRGGGSEVEDAAEASARQSALDIEAEIEAFMEQSADPMYYPSKEELLAAGRPDLVEAILAENSWFSYGWSVGRPPDDGKIERGLNTEREMENAGIEGILKRLEKERGWSYADRALWKGLQHSRGDGACFTESTGGPLSSNLEGNSSENLEDFHFTDGTSAKDASMKSQSPDTWRTWSLRRPGFPANEFEAAEIVPGEDKKQPDQNLIHNVATNDKMQYATAEKMGEPYSDSKEDGKYQIHMRLQHLESELKSVLQLLGPRSNDYLQEAQVNSLKELLTLSDTLDFQETEITKSQDKLREAQMIVADKQKRLDAAQKALHDLHTACVMLIRPASEVLLAGSFDGWTSQIRMERLSAGIFSLYLMLYPGRYEIKFLVDGVWTVDPLQPTVNISGHENNLLVVNAKVVQDV